MAKPFSDVPMKSKIDVSKFISYIHPKFLGENFKKKHKDFIEREFPEISDEFSKFHRDTANDLVKITSSEFTSRKDLEILAIRTVKKLFPVIKMAGIRITADIDHSISHSDLSLRGTPNFPKEIPDDISDDEFNKIAKQKYLNGLIQGAAIKMNRVHHLEEESLKPINSDLIKMYDNVLKNNEFICSTTNRIQLAMGAIALNNKKRIMGTNKVSFENGVPRITAKANNFIILVHEIIKGLYTYLTLNAYKTEEEYYNITEYTDSIFSEIDEIAIGKCLIDDLRNYVFSVAEDKQIDQPAFFEMFIVKLSKIPANDFMELIKGLNDGNPNENKFKSIIFDTSYELKKFDRSR